MAASDKSQRAISELSQGNIAFSKRVYGALKANPGNIFFSPASLEFALALLYAGTEGKTAQEIQTCLALPDPKEKTYSAVSASLDGLTGSKGVTLNIANGLFADEKFSIKSTYSDIAKKFFAAQIARVKFGSNEAVNTINQYVSKETKQKINELFNKDAFDDLTRLVIVNAIYFKGDWAFKFDPSSTFKGDFHLSKSEKVQVDFMNQKERFKVTYSEELDSTILALPYKDKKLSMVLIVPNEIDGLKKVEDMLPKLDLLNLVKDTYEEEVILTMPKFKLTQTMELKKVLTDLGMSEMFSDRADLSGISSEPLYVSAVIQKTYIEVNEEGSEAAAATAGSCRRKRSAYMFVEVDRPFMFFIRDEEIILFVGSIKDAFNFDGESLEITYHNEL